MAAPHYNERHYVWFRDVYLKANVIPCWHDGCENRATSPDHYPPISAHTHVAGSGCCRLKPACKGCQDRQGAAIRNAKSGSGYSWP